MRSPSGVDVRPRAPCRPSPADVHVDSELRQGVVGRLVPECVLTEGREELATALRAAPAARATTAPPRPAPARRARRVHDLPRGGHARDAGELHPFDVADDCASHDSGPCHVSRSWGRWLRHGSRRSSSSTSLTATRCSGISGGCSGTRRGCVAETFLRALRAYGRLEHGRHLRAWVFTIATNVALDELRVTRRTVAARRCRAGHRVAARGVSRARASDRRPATDRACGSRAPLGYDLPYTQIADALGSSEEAARAAASSGVRRLRRTHERDH